MRHKYRRWLSLLLVLSMLTGLFAATAAAAPAAEAAQIYDLRVDDLTAPVGIDNPNPMFGWKMKSDVVGAAQSAYSICVTDEAGTQVWNTGWVQSDRSAAIPYSGAALAASERYTVEVAVRDQNGAESNRLPAFCHFHRHDLHH